MMTICSCGLVNMLLVVITLMRLYHILLIYGKKQSQWGYPIPEEQTTLGGGKWIKRAIWALPYYHYKGVKDISDDNLKYTKIATEYVGIEGGGGYYDANSGGYDVLGLGTLMYAR